MSNASTTTAVYEAAQELHAMGTEITRHTIAELTQLPTVVVDDRLRALAEDGRIKRLVRGVYAVVKQYPPTRPMSKTVLADGFVKIEIGDEVLTLTPREDRVLGGADGRVGFCRRQHRPRGTTGRCAGETATARRHTTLIARLLPPDRPCAGFVLWRYPENAQSAI